MRKNILISVVTPVYMAEKIVELLVLEIAKAVEAITSDYEIILVEDGSKDNSWECIVKECKKDKRVKGVKLSRNFGQHYAITAGLDKAKGEWIVLMDCDLQDQPSEIIKLFNKANQGYDIVLARRESRKDKKSKIIFSNLFYKVLGYLTGTNQDPAVANFGIYHSKVIAAVSSLRESIRYFPTMVKWVGFKSSSVNVDHDYRKIGKTSYNFKRLLKLSLDIILSNSDKPIKLTIKVGFTIAFISFLMGIYTFIRYQAGQITVLGYTSLLISIWFLSGIILAVLGIIGLYIGKTFEGVKKRPIYIIDQEINQ
jgi:dolichol-phosphate mannosyltransferase